MTSVSGSSIWEQGQVKKKKKTERDFEKQPPGNGKIQFGPYK